MKHSFLVIAVGVVMSVSCKKENSCAGCLENNRAPLADAGIDQEIILPRSIAKLDGTSSIDLDNNIANYTWTKISGPVSYNIVNANAIRTQVTNLAEGTFLFELTVTDAGGLFDRDSVRIEVKPQPNQQSLGNVIFYCPDPTGTVKPMWQTWDNGDPVNGLYNLITIKINSLSGLLAGVWCKNDCLPKCPVENDYNVELGNYAGFNLPPGSYSWSAENTITNFSGWPEVTSDFAQFFRTTHKVGGTVTVLAGDKCILQPILF